MTVTIICDQCNEVFDEYADFKEHKRLSHEL